MADYYLARFKDGPMAKLGNVPNALGQLGTLALPRETWNWPLPARLKVLCCDKVTGMPYPSVALWDADDPADADGLPAMITESPNLIVYRKVVESQMPAVADEHANVARGAEYELDGDVEDEDKPEPEEETP